jgi:hypothetical protein
MQTFQAVGGGRDLRVVEADEEVLAVAGCACDEAIDEPRCSVVSGLTGGSSVT